MRLSVVLFLAGCSGSPAPAPEAVPALAPMAAPSPVEEPVPVADDPGAAVPEVEVEGLERALDRPVRSLALGMPRVAALVDEEGGVVPWWRDGDTWKPLPLPENLRWTEDPDHPSRIHFGRNDRPRIMGGQRVDGASAPLYLRYKGSQWIAEREEIAELADPPAAPMWGVLGHADPEVVCKLDQICIIKRLTGWTRMPAGPGAPRVDLQGPLAYAVHPDRVALLDGTAWRVVSEGLELEGARGAWGDGSAHWIAAANGLWHGDAEGWTQHASPVGEPAMLWGAAPDEVWLAGEDGLARWDGSAWARVRGVAGPLTEVLGRPGEVWAAGPSGAWRLDGR